MMSFNLHRAEASHPAISGQPLHEVAGIFHLIGKYRLIGPLPPPQSRKRVTAEGWGEVVDPRTGAEGIASLIANLG